MRNIAIFGTACAVAVGALCVVQSHAADLGAFYPAPAPLAEPDAQYEFGTGWYLRGDASFGEEDHPVLDSTPAITTKQDWNYVLGGGVGYKFNSFLRVDVSGDYIAPNTIHRTDVLGNGVVLNSRASVQKYDALANLYIDLGTWYGLTPYVGGGAGVAVYDPSEHLALDIPTPDNTSSQTRFAWAAMAGVSYQVDQNIAVDVGYRHLDLGRFSTTLVGYAIDHRYTEDQVRIGLRYMIF